jgi:hypothetical protein
LHDRSVGRDRGAVNFGKQRQRLRLPGVIIEDLDGLAPDRCL